ncbi:MAG: hypothetical protein HY898_16385 [Deltaproteobacteria bacterium]|nr:hypothetical protein [Deltaproteobacteria bacterium]
MLIRSRFGGATVVLCAAVLLGCSSSSDGGASEPLNGGIGQICSSSDCPAGLSCRSDTKDWIAHHQCTMGCSTSGECTSKFGPNTMCIGAAICVSTCTSDTGCPTGTVCNENGWCGNTGPGSGVPVCSGTPTPCSLLDHSTCITAFGCTAAADCSGVPASCYSQSTSYTCSSMDGCSWSSSSSSCSGSATPCSLISGPSTCGSQSGCHWNESCSGVQDPCGKTSASLCKYAPGCSLVYQ